ncbi:MAG: His/Gly/Thr/Pro-type tRNA ligase C-terminal domain-containing protein [Agathobacter sp.]|nr:His/Gly/Thr/Pro-type tRNA ligase C-terminal domain-containing protein [Agathobacter sp.]
MDWKYRKRYRRGDAIGIPYVITVDDATLKNNTVTACKELMNIFKVF